MPTKLPNFTPKLAPTVAISATYGKPLLKGFFSQIAQADKVLLRYQKQLLGSIRKHILQATFSDAAKRRLSQAVRVKVHGNSVRVTTRDPAWRPLIEGQKRGAMKWLVKARAPIPIVTDTGEVIFRTATAKSIRNGKWVHPGRPKQNVVKRAKEDARKMLQKTLRAEVARELRRATK